MIKVLIPECIPSSNKGEMAILEGLRATLAICGQYELTVYSPQPFCKDDTRNSRGRYRVVTGVDLYKSGIRTRKPSRFKDILLFLSSWGFLYTYSVVWRVSRSLAACVFRDALFRSMSEADLILAGHDGMLGPYQVHLVLACRIMGKPVALFGGSDDFTGRQRYSTRKSLQWAVRYSLLYCVRDPGAKEYMLANDILDKDVHVIPDPAVLLEPCDSARAHQILDIEGVPHPRRRTLYALIPANGGIVPKHAFSSEGDLSTRRQCRVELWKRIVTHLLKNTNAHFVFLPHCIGPMDYDDRIMNRAIFSTLEAHRDRCTIIDAEYTAAELKGIMRECQYVLSERAHALIGSVSAGTPCMALSVKEDLRMHWLLERLFGRPVFDLNRPDVDQITRALVQEWKCRDQTRLQMGAEADKIRMRAIDAARLLKSRIESVHTLSLSTPRGDF